MDKNVIKSRIFPDKNYKAVWHNGKTLRIALDPSKAIGELDYPEFYDVKITNYCEGKCPWCYQDSTKDEAGHFDNIVSKVHAFFGSMTENQKPFQVAIGGGEPTSHPDFTKVLEAFHGLGIVPNYTTNGMFAHSPDKYGILKATGEFCGGVAVSCHPHLRVVWERALSILSYYGIKTNLHLIMSDEESVREFERIYKKYSDTVDYFVLLPHTAQGRAEPKEINWPAIKAALPEKADQIAFGANFYPYLVEDSDKLDVSLYEPEIMSKYVTLEGSGAMYKSSFDVEKPVRRDLWK